MSLLGRASVEVSYRDKIFFWYQSSAWPYKLLLSGCAALATAYAAQVTFFLPWTPVPIALHPLVVLLAGVLLGKWWGALSQALYVGCGMCGVPFFSGMQGGLGVLIGPRGGYLMGFILTSFVVGAVFERYKTLRGFFSIFFLRLILRIKRKAFRHSFQLFPCPN